MLCNHPLENQKGFKGQWYVITGGLSCRLDLLCSSSQWVLYLPYQTIISNPRGGRRTHVLPVLVPLRPLTNVWYMSLPTGMTLTNCSSMLQSVHSKKSSRFLKWTDYSMFEVIITDIYIVIHTRILCIRARCQAGCIGWPFWEDRSLAIRVFCASILTDWWVLLERWKGLWVTLFFVSVFWDWLFSS